MGILNDIITFLKRFWTIVFDWFMETIQKHKFTNVLVPIISIVAMVIFRGKFWDVVGFSTIFFWAGMNVQGLISVFKELKKKNNW